MRAGQFHNRRPRNAIGAGGRRAGDEFNSSLKRERHPEPPQYPTSKVEERTRYAESRDARPKRAESRLQSSSSSSRREASRSKSGSSSRSMKSARNMTQGFVRSAVGMMAGAVIVVNSYQAQVEKRELARTETIIAAALSDTSWLDGAWTWSDDLRTVTLTVPGLGEIAATVTETVEPPTCLEDGTITYTAAADLGGHSFTDEREEPGDPATGHTFGAPESSDGRTVFRCENCGEQFEIGYGITKEH